MPNALVTGATEGIGRATALALGRAGFAVGVCARTESKVTSLLAELRQTGIKAAGRAADVGDPDDVDRMVADVERQLGPVDVLVNNAGVLIGKTLEDLTLEDWDATMATNVRSLFLVTRRVLPGMRNRRRGTIVNIASVSGKFGFIGGVARCCWRHGGTGCGSWRSALGRSQPVCCATSRCCRSNPSGSSHLRTSPRASCSRCGCLNEHSSTSWRSDRPTHDSATAECRGGASLLTASPDVVR
jgi:NAD(P)-dependent dehydrogenase (short-subunit alcohol dehydrogenase family)